MTTDEAIERLRVVGPTLFDTLTFSPEEEDELLQRVIAGARQSSRPDRSASLRPRWTYALVVAGSIVVTVVAVIAVPGGEGPSNPAAAQLDALASVASTQALPALQPGQYYNQVWDETLVWSDPPGTVVPPQPIPNAVPYWGNYTLQTQLSTWVGPDGIGRCTTSPIGITGTSASGTQPGFSAVSIDGEPMPPAMSPGSLYMCPIGTSSDANGNGSSGTAEAGNGSVGQVQDGVPLQLFDVAALSTDPTTLARQIAERAPGVPPLQGSYFPSQPNVMFAAVAQLLAGPDQGGTPALRAALYQVLAGLPGVQVTDGVVDALGRSGTAISIISSPGGGVPTWTSEAIVDPNTGAILDWITKANSADGGPNPGIQTETLALAAAGVVGSNTAVAGT